MRIATALRWLASLVSRQAQVPGSIYINETSSIQAQVPGGIYMNEGGA